MFFQCLLNDCNLLYLTAIALFTVTLLFFTCLLPDCNTFLTVFLGWLWCFCLFSGVMNQYNSQYDVRCSEPPQKRQGLLENQPANHTLKVETINHYSHCHIQTVKLDWFNVIYNFDIFYLIQFKLCDKITNTKIDPQFKIDTLNNYSIH